MRISTLPPRFIVLFSAIRAASICWLVNLPQQVAFKAKSPVLKALPTWEQPFNLPLNAFLYFTFLGLNI
jgi:hypothetical protein